MNLMFGFGWVEFLFVAVFIFIIIMWQVYWLEKRNLAVGFTFLIIGSGYSLIGGIWSLFNVYVGIADGWPSFSSFLNILTFIFVVAWSFLWIGLGIYGLNSAYRNLRTVFGVLRERRTKMN